MIFLMESVIACLMFTLLIKLISHNRQEVFTNDYPPVVTDKLRAMGLIAKKPPAKKKDVFRKLIALVIYAILFALLLRHVNGITTFDEAALTAFRKLYEYRQTSVWQILFYPQPYSHNMSNLYAMKI